MEDILEETLEFEYGDEIERDMEYVEEEPEVIYIEGAAEEIYDNAQDAAFCQELTFPENEEEVQYVDSNNEQYTAESWRLHNYPEMYQLNSCRTAGQTFNSVGFFVRDADGIVLPNNASRLPSMGLDIRKTRRLNLVPNVYLGEEQDTSPVKTSEKYDFDEEEEEPYVPHSSHFLTPLPDKFFVRRSTGSAQMIGFQSIAALCDKCMFAFRTKTAYQKHMEQHNNNLEVHIPRSHLYCPKLDCEVRSDCLATLIEHVRSYHGHDDLVFESIEFNDMEQFKKWKSEMERLTNSRYTRTSGKHNVFSKSTYFQCHFSGSPSTGKGSNSQIIRNRGSKKMGRSCTAFLHLKEREDGKVELRGCVKHTGHEETARNMPLTDNIKRDIAIYLLQGLSEHQIVDIMRQGCAPDDRRYYLQAYEVRNVQTKLNKHQEAMAKNMHVKEDYLTNIIEGDVKPSQSNLNKSDSVAYSELSMASRPAEGEKNIEKKAKRFSAAQSHITKGAKRVKTQTNAEVDEFDEFAFSKTDCNYEGGGKEETSKPQITASIIEKDEVLDHSLFVKRKIDPETLLPVKKGPKPKKKVNYISQLKEQAAAVSIAPASEVPGEFAIGSEEK